MSSGDSCGGSDHRSQDRWLSDGDFSTSISRSYSEVARMPPRATPTPPPPPPQETAPTGARRAPASTRIGPRSEVHRVRNDVAPRRANVNGWQQLQRRHHFSGAWSPDMPFGTTPTRSGAAAVSSPAMAAGVARLSSGPTTAPVPACRQERTARPSAAGLRQSHRHHRHPSNTPRLLLRQRTRSPPWPRHLHLLFNRSNHLL
jgi:hypothetical protein